MTKRPWLWFLVWTLTAAASWVLGFLGGGIVRDLFTTTNAAISLSALAYAIVAVAISSILVGFAQSFLLPVEWKLQVRWFGWTSIGTLLGVFIILILGGITYLLLATWIEAGTAGDVSQAGDWVRGVLEALAFAGAIVIGCVGLGMTVGVAQWRLLRGRVQNPGLWIGATLIGWVGALPLALVAVFVVQPILSLIYQRDGFNLDPFTLSCVSGAVIAIATGLAMKRFLTRPYTPVS